MERGSEKGRGKCERKESGNWEVKVDVEVSTGSG
jgi:hypothetical protein